MRTLLKVVAVILLIVSFGCNESAIRLTVNKDGSGRIIVQEFFSPQMLGMLGSFEQMAEGIVEAMDVEEKPDTTRKSPEGLGIFDSMIQKQAEKMGAGVKLVKKEKKKNEMGWEGFEATYEFEDINKIRVGVGGTEMEDASTTMESKGEIAYTFKFKPGNTATLEMIPQQEKPEASTEEKAEESEQEKVDDDMMMEMMAPMLKGFRMMFTVSVDGTIQDTNANYRSQEQANMITVVDLPFDKLLADAEIRKMMFATEDPNEAMSMLKDAGITDVIFEPPDKTISIQFK